MSKYATGRRALARCPRCGDKVRYLDLVPDGEIPGQRVCRTCQDIKHPAERPFDATDATALRKPAPDVDDDSPGDSGTTLAEELFPGENIFGGNT